MFNLSKIKKQNIILILIVDAVVSVLLILLYAFKVINTTIFTVLFFICLITFTTITSGLMGLRMQKKMAKKRRGTLYHLEKLPELNEKGTMTFDLNYGKVYLLLKDKKVYNVTIVENAPLFFSDKQEPLKYKIDDRKYQKACQFFIFHNPVSSVERKLTIMNYQAQKFFVGSFAYYDDTKEFFQTDNVRPKEDFVDLYNDLFTYLNIQ